MLLAITFIIFSVIAISISKKPVYAATDIVAENEEDSKFTFTEIVDEEGNTSYSVALKAAFRSTIQIIIIPETYKDIPVVEIANNGFMSCTKLKKVFIPKSIKKIGKNAFINCKVLERIALPCVEYIDDNAFSMCSSLDNVFIPKTANYVGATVFRNNSNRVYIQKSAAEVNSEWSASWANYQTGEVFYDSNVTDTLEYRQIIKDNTVIGVEITENTSLASCDDVVLYNAVKLDDETGYLPVINICTGAFSMNFLSSLTFRDIHVVDESAPEYDHKINILSNAFEGAFIDEIYFEVGITFVHPNDVKTNSGYLDNTICTSDGNDNSQNIFLDSSIKKIILPKDLKNIVNGMFNRCSALEIIQIYGEEYTEVNVLPKIKKIGDFAFGSCSSLNNIYIPQSVEEVGKNVFNDWGIISEQLININLYEDDLPIDWNQNWKQGINANCQIKYLQPSEVALIFNDENNQTIEYDRIYLKVGKALPDIVIKEREGYIFKGIFANPNGEGTQFYDSEGKGQKIWDDCQKVLYVKWDECSSILKFDNGGEFKVNYGATVPAIGKPNMPSGYDFAGYYMELEDGSRIYYYDDNLVGKKWDRTDKEVFLHLDKKPINYQINYENITEKEFESCPKSFNVENRISIVFPDLHRNGYSLEWDIKQIPENHFDNITVTAIWSPITYYIYFTYDYTDTTNEELKSHEESEWTFTVEDEITLPEIEIAGYDFEWDRNHISKGTFENVYVKGTWSLIRYEINYEFESKGLANPNPRTYTIEDTIEFKKLIKEHYSFEWVPSKIEKGTTDSLTIKGEWNAKEYYITYENLTEDTNHKNKQTYTVEDTLNEGILIAAATRGGYFCEWDINEIPKGHTGDITITVNYIEKTLDQCFNQGIYEIYTPNQFYHLSTQPNGGKGRNYLLMKDLYGLGGYKPVDAFYGNFNGNGHYLSGFWFENSDSEFVGFVGQNFGTIKNLKLGVAITVSSSSNVYAGAFCGENRGTIENCSAFGVRNSPSFSFYATAESFAGGITGVNYGTVKNCGKGLDMSGTSNMGGIVGLNYGNIDGCTNNQEIQINYEGINCCVGGIVGKQESGSTKSCFYNGTIRLLNYNQPSSELANDRNIQICAGIIIGYKKSGVAINNTYENAPGIPGDIVKDVIGLRVVTWTTGSLWWAQTHTHNQALYFKNSTCGRED